MNGVGSSWDRAYAYQEARNKAFEVAQKAGPNKYVAIGVETKSPSAEASDSPFQPVHSETYVIGSGNTRQEALDSDINPEGTIRPGVADSQPVSSRETLIFNTNDLLEGSISAPQKAPGMFGGPVGYGSGHDEHLTHQEHVTTKRDHDFFNGDRGALKYTPQEIYDGQRRSDELERADSIGRTSSLECTHPESCFFVVSRRTIDNSSENPPHFASIVVPKKDVRKTLRKFRHVFISATFRRNATADY